MKKNYIPYTIIENIQKRLQPTLLKQGVVSISFDDQLQTTYDNALLILEKYDMLSTWFICTDHINGTDPNSKLPCISWKAIIHLSQIGHEIGSHSKSHPHFSNHSPNRVIKELKDSKKMIQDHLGVPVNSFAYPFSDCGWKENIPYIAGSVYKYCRGGEFGINSWPLRLHSLFAVKLYEKRNHIDYYKALIDICLKQNKWIIFYTHDVCNHYSDFGCSPLFFETLLEYIKLKSIQVLPIQQVFQ